MQKVITCFERRVKEKLRKKNGRNENRKEEKDLRSRSETPEIMRFRGDCKRLKYINRCE